MNVSRALGAPFGSVFGRFLVLLVCIVGFQAYDWLKMADPTMDLWLRMVGLVENAGLLLENGVSWEATWGHLEVAWGHLEVT